MYEVPSPQSRCCSLLYPPSVFFSFDHLYLPIVLNARHRLAYSQSCFFFRCHWTKRLESTCHVIMVFLFPPLPSPLRYPFPSFPSSLPISFHRPSTVICLPINVPPPLHLIWSGPTSEVYPLLSLIHLIFFSQNIYF